LLCTVTLFAVLFQKMALTQCSAGGLFGPEDMIWRVFLLSISLHFTVYESDLINKPHLPHLAPGFTGQRSGKKADGIRGSVNLLGGRFRDQKPFGLL